MLRRSRLLFLPLSAITIQAGVDVDCTVRGAVSANCGAASAEANQGGLRQWADTAPRALPNHRHKGRESRGEGSRPTRLFPLRPTANLPVLLRRRLLFVSIQLQRGLAAVLLLLPPHVLCQLILEHLIRRPLTSRGTCRAGRLQKSRRFLAEGDSRMYICPLGGRCGVDGVHCKFARRQDLGRCRVLSPAFDPLEVVDGDTEDRVVPVDNLRARQRWHSLVLVRDSAESGLHRQHPLPPKAFDELGGAIEFGGQDVREQRARRNHGELGSRVIFCR